MTQIKLTLFLASRAGRGDCAAVNRRITMTPTQIANLEAVLLQLARDYKNASPTASAAYANAASLLIEAASKPACRTRRKLTTS